MKCDHCDEDGSLESYLKSAKWALWFALIVNLVMFFVELGSSFQARSESLKADAIDFFSDSASYAMTLFVLRSSEKARNKAAWIKGLLMLLLGLWVIGTALYRVFNAVLPEAPTMGWIGFTALVANLSVTAVLFRFRSRDMNMRSVWLCSRNDAIANLAVIAAALGVWTTSTQWPDLIVASIIAALNLSAAVEVFRGV